MLRQGLHVSVKAGATTLTCDQAIMARTPSRLVRRWHQGEGRRRAALMRCARSLDFAWLLRIRTLGRKSAHCAKSLIVRPSAAQLPTNRLRLLSCHRTVGRSAPHRQREDLANSAIHRKARSGDPSAVDLAQSRRRALASMCRSTCDQPARRSRLAGANLGIGQPVELRNSCRRNCD